jgi:2-methylcitrate dehydratase PrpD
MTAPTASLALAQHIQGLRAGALNPSTREAALRCVLDVVCAAAAGFNDPGVVAARDTAIALFGHGTCGIWFSGKMAGAGASLMANSSATAALDLDDGCRMARGHLGAAAIPAAWAMLHALPKGAQAAEEFLTAIIAGYEAGARMSMGQLSYVPSGAWSPYAAIAAAGRLCRSPPGVMAQAFGIAAQCAPALPGLAGLMGSDVKEGIPWGSVTGLAALRLAQSGFTGPAQIFDEPSIFAADRILDGLGDTPLIEQTYFKPFACCRHIHAPLAAYLGLLAQYGFAPSDVSAVEVHTYRATFNLSNLPRPRTLVEAQYSVPYCMALCAVHGPQALVPMAAAQLDDAGVSAFALRVTVQHDPQIEPLFPSRSPARVVVTLRDGSRLASDVTDPKGDPMTPLSWQELEGKFLMATAKALQPARQVQVLDAIRLLRDGDIAPLREALR